MCLIKQRARIASSILLRQAMVNHRNHPCKAALCEIKCFLHKKQSCHPNRREVAALPHFMPAPVLQFVALSLVTLVLRPLSYRTRNTALVSMTYMSLCRKSPCIDWGCTKMSQWTLSLINPPQSTKKALVPTETTSKHHLKQIYWSPDEYFSGKGKAHWVCVITVRRWCCIQADKFTVAVHKSKGWIDSKKSTTTLRNDFRHVITLYWTGWFSYLITRVT